VRVSVRQRRCSVSGTKLKTSSCDTSRFTNRSASRKSVLHPRRPRWDKACARCSVLDIRPASSHPLQIGLQYPSSAPQAGFQYCAVDSITASSTRCSMSHSDSARNCSGLLPYQRRSNENPRTIQRQPRRQPVRSCEHRFPLSDRTSPSSWQEWRACRAYINLGHGLSPLRTGGNAPSIRSITHAPDQTYIRPKVSNVSSISPIPAARHYASARSEFHGISRAGGPTQLTWMPVTVSMTSITPLWAEIALREASRIVR